GPKEDACAGAATLDLGLFELAGRLAARERLNVLLAVAPDGSDELFGERVDHRAADAVEAARVNIVALLELAARVQRAEDELERVLLVLGDVIDGNAATVVLDGDGAAILGDGDPDLLGEPVDHLVDRVVDDFP